MNISKVKFLVSVILTLFICIACSEDEEEPFVFISVDGSTNFDIKGGSRQIDVTSNTQWTVKITVEEGDEGWLTANTNSGSGGKTITVSASENKTVKARKAKVKFTCSSDASKIISRTDNSLLSK